MSSLLLPDFMQVAFVVHDLDDAVRRWSDELDIGPWTAYRLDPTRIREMRYHEQDVAFSFLHALAWQGKLQFELVQPLDGPSIYKEFLEEHGEGVQHIACMMHSQADSDEFKKEWQARGSKVLMGGRIGETIEFYYLDTEPMLKFILESGSGHAIDLTPSRVYPPA